MAITYTWAVTGLMVQNEGDLEQALEWTKGALGEDRVTAMEGEVADQITKAAIPVPQPAPLPWA